MPTLPSFKTLLIACFTIILLITGFLVFKYWQLQTQRVIIINNISEHKIALSDEGNLTNYLRSQGFLGRNNIEKLEVVLVEGEVENPFIVQKDKEGNIVISTSAEIVGDTALIKIAVGDYINTKVEHSGIGRWLDSQFWEAVNLLYKRASGTSRVSIESNNQSVFKVEKI